MVVFRCLRPPPYLHSFPTRRSSDLASAALVPGARAPDRLRATAGGRERATGREPGGKQRCHPAGARQGGGPSQDRQDRKSTRLNSSHVEISYAVFCLQKKILCPSSS